MKIKPTETERILFDLYQGAKRRKEDPPSTIGKIIMMLKDFTAEWERNNLQKAARMSEKETEKLHLIRLGWNCTIFNNLHPFILRHRIRKMVLFSLKKISFSSFQTHISAIFYVSFWFLVDDRVRGKPSQSSAEFWQVPGNDLPTWEVAAGIVKIEEVDLDSASNSSQKTAMHFSPIASRKLFSNLKMFWNCVYWKGCYNIK